MTVKDQLKILDNKIRKNKVDFDLNRKNAEISALSLGKLNKYSYLTDQDLKYRPDPVQKARFEYSPLGQIFNKGLITNKKQKGLLKRLKNIEDKTENQLDLIRDQGDRQLDLIGKSYTQKTDNITFENEDNEKLRDLAKYIKSKTKEIVNKNFFNKKTHLGDFANRLYDKELFFDKAKKEQKDFLKEIDELEGRINPKIEKQPSDKNKKNMNEVVENAKELYEKRNYILDTSCRPESELHTIIENAPLEYLKEDKNYVAFVKKLKAFLRKVLKKDYDTKKDAYVGYTKEIGTYAKKIKEPKQKINPEAKTIMARDFINNLEYSPFGLKPTSVVTDEVGALLPETEEQSREEASRALLELANGTTTGSGLKIMTPNQLITRLSILLSQRVAGNNSNKLKNKIRQIIYSLYRSKNLTKTVNNHLINNI